MNRESEVNLTGRQDRIELIKYLSNIGEEAFANELRNSNEMLIKCSDPKTAVHVCLYFMKKNINNWRKSHGLSTIRKESRKKRSKKKKIFIMDEMMHLYSRDEDIRRLYSFNKEYIDSLYKRARKRM